MTLNLGAPTHCKHCGSTSLYWFPHLTTSNTVAQGRLRTTDIKCLFALGCEECSDTSMQVDADTIANRMNEAAPEASLILPLEPPFPKRYIATGTRVKDGVSTPVYLTWSSEGGGWYQWSTVKHWAKTFVSEKAALSAADGCPGPTVCLPQDGTVTTEQVHGSRARKYLQVLEQAQAALTKEGSA